MSAAIIAPLKVSVLVDCSPKETFRIFSEGIETWWPLQTHSVGADTFEGKVKAETMIFEGRVGGRIYECMSDGREADWGMVLVWQPPHRVVFSWKPNLEPVPHTEVEVRFTPEGPGTRVELEHRAWERLGEAGVEKRRRYEAGWAGVLERFVRHAQGLTSQAGCADG